MQCLLKMHFNTSKKIYRQNKLDQGMTRINKDVEAKPERAVILTITVGHIHSYIQRETRAEREKSPIFFLHLQK